MADKPTPAQDEQTGRFLTGNIGGGRKAGARNRLGEAFIQALHDSFVEHGEDTIETVRTEKPDQYLKVIASLLPRDVNLTVDKAESLTDDEIRDRIRALAEQLAPMLGGNGDAKGGAGSENGAKQPSRVH